MRIVNGCTRLVVLTKTKAIKIAFPLSPLAPFRIVLQAWWKGELGRKTQAYRGDLIRIALRVATIGGIDSNRRELRLSREHPEYPIAPVLRSYLWGYVIVMARGDPIEENCKPWTVRVQLPAKLQESDVFCSRNTCRIEGVLRLVDYGDPSAEEVLPFLS